MQTAFQLQILHLVARCCWEAVESGPHTSSAQKLPLIQSSSWQLWPRKQYSLEHFGTKQWPARGCCAAGQLVAGAGYTGSLLTHPTPGFAQEGRRNWDSGCLHVTTLCLDTNSSSKSALDADVEILLRGGIP